MSRLFLGVALAATTSAAFGCARATPSTPPGCLDCPDPQSVVRLPPEDLERQLVSLERRWSKVSADSPSAAECGELARSFASLADLSGRPVAVGLFNAGVVRETCGQPELAMELYRAVIAAPGAPPRIRAAALNNLGIALVKVGELENGSRALEKAVETDPLFGAPRTNLAALLRKRSGKDDKAFVAAEHELHTALALRADDRRAFEHLARLYYERGREGDPSYLMLADLVVTQGLRVLERDGESSAALFNVRGLILVERGDPNQALRAFDKAVEIDPGHLESHVNRAMISLRLRDFATARASLAIALADPRFARDADAWLAMGVAHRGLRDYDRAEKAFTFVHEVTQDPRGFYNLGLLYQEHIAPNQDYDPEPYRVAQRHFARFAADAGDRPDYSAAVVDARRRSDQIDELFVAIHDTRVIEKQVKELEVLEKKQRAQEKARLLELERRAREHRDAGEPGG